MDFSQLKDGLENFDINELDINNVGSWPLAVRLIVLVIGLVAVLSLGYFYHVKDLQTKYDSELKKEEKLKKDFERKSFKAANLDEYRVQMDEMEKTFGALLRQLPSDTEVPGLLEDISHTGLGSGLQFKSISLQSERQAPVYVELPIEIQVVGGYHDFGAFVSGISALPRIVTLHDFKIVPSAGGLLTMNIMAKTYRYASDAEGEEGGK